jgi:hypothetical protein
VIPVKVGPSADGGDVHREPGAGSEVEDDERRRPCEPERREIINGVLYVLAN